MRRAHLVESYQPGSQIVEEENDVLSQELSDKVKALKSLSIDIGTEVREQNKYIRDMDDDFEKSGGFLKSTMARVVKMAGAGHNRFIWYILLFMLFVFMVCWIIIKTR